MSLKTVIGSAVTKISTIFSVGSIANHLRLLVRNS